MSLIVLLYTISMNYFGIEKFTKYCGIKRINYFLQMVMRTLMWKKEHDRENNAKIREQT